MIVLAWNHAENHLKYRGYPKCFEVCETRMCSINLPHIQVRETKNTRLRWVYTWARDTVRWYSSAESPLRQLSIDHNIDVQSVFSWAPKLARKCTRKHWYIYLICISVYLSNLYISNLWWGRTVGRAGAWHDWSVKQYKTEQPAIDGHSLLFSAQFEKNNSTSDLQSGPSCGIVGKKRRSGNTPWWLLHHDLLWTTCCHRNTKGFLTQQLLPLQDLFQAP